MQYISSKTVDLINDTFETYCNEYFDDIEISAVRSTYIYGAIAIYACTPHGLIMLKDTESLFDVLNKFVDTVKKVSEDNIAKTTGTPDVSFERFTVLMNRLVIPSLFASESRGYGSFEIVDSAKEANCVLMDHAVDGRPIGILTNDKYVLEPINTLTKLSSTSCKRVFYKFNITKDPHV